MIDPRVAIHLATTDRRGEFVARPIELLFAGSQLHEIHDARSIGSRIPGRGVPEIQGGTHWPVGKPGGGLGIRSAISVLWGARAARRRRFTSRPLWVIHGFPTGYRPGMACVVPAREGCWSAFPGPVLEVRFSGGHRGMQDVSFLPGSD